MKYLLLLFISFNASAACYYMPDLNDSSIYKIECRSRTPGTQVCKVDKDWNSQDVKVEILTPSYSILNIAGILDSYRDWSQGDTLTPGESIVCSIDSNKKSTRLTLEQDEKNAEKAKKDAKDLSWKNLCILEKNTVSALTCQRYGYPTKP